MDWMGIGGEEREAGDVRVWVGNTSQQSQMRSGATQQSGGWGVGRPSGSQMASFTSSPWLNS